ncbi:MAG: outer membrane beta-barrel protein [Bacteroidales bacterium]|nr:outer membrane beta-barrel protein [Bacteroidales bacterium]
MKHFWKYVILPCLFLMPALSYGQLVRWGLYAGTQLPFHTEAVGNNINYLENANFNVGAQLKLDLRLHCQTGIGCSVHSQSVRRTDLDTAADLRSNYINIPLLAGFNLIDQDAFKLRITGGVEYRMLVWVSPNDLSLQKSDFNLHNGNLIGGVGLNLNRLSLDVQCRHPFTSVMKEVDKENLSFWLAVGFFF